MREPKILFLYISVSSGHQQAAESIQKAIKEIVPEAKTLGLDSFNYAYPFVGKFIAGTYLQIVKRTPFLWDYLYDNPDVVTATQEIREVLNRLNSRKFKKLLASFHPSAVVCTQAVPCSVVAAAKRHRKINVPLIAVITDFAAHAYWVYKEVDAYVVANESTRRELMKKGIPEEKIYLFGIPINPVFNQQVGKEDARLSLGFKPNLPVLLVMGGSQGLGPIESILSALDWISIPFQVAVITGLNEKLRRSLKKDFAKSIHRFHIFGYIDGIDKFMEAADILITKPGGLTSSEALAKGLPMIIVNPIPGQEERNSSYLIKHGVAERADNLEELAHYVSDFFSHPVKLSRMRHQALSMAQPDAAYNTALLVLKQIGWPTIV
ncbi:MAG: glycosyltransferase [Elusimicrobiota bacterium]